MTTILFELFITGLAMAWGPCLISCSIMIPYFAGTKKGFKHGVRGALLFSCGRLIAYIFLGALAGFSGELLSSLYYISNFRFKLQIGGGIFIFLLGLSIVFVSTKQSAICKFLHKWDHGSVFLAGIFLGLVPCAPLLAVLSYIVLHSTNHLVGGFQGFVFGLGTIFSPFLLLAGFATYFTKFISNEKLYFSFQKICGLVVMYLGIKSILNVFLIANH
ncbi:sulfite exporter TauE/SafE family protein [bacterium]